MTYVNFADITHAHAQQNDDTTHSGELTHTISHITQTQTSGNDVFTGKLLTD
jgi:hypothetical protein